MVTLALETSTPHGGVALFDGEALVFREEFTADRSHSSELFAVIERALSGAPAPGQIVVGLGPGSYAGVRIGIAAGIGLSMAKGAELAGVPSIAALDAGDYAVAGDARRGGYWHAEVRAGVLAKGPELVSREELEARAAAGPLRLFTSEELAFLQEAERRYPQVELLGRAAIAGRGVTARGILEPIYLREPHITTPRG